MNTLHPIMQAAMAPFSPRIASMLQFSYTLDGVRLGCWLDYEAATPSSEFEPGHPATAELQTAYVGAVDISQLLSDDQVAEIETAFLKDAK